MKEHSNIFLGNLSYVDLLCFWETIMIKHLFKVGILNDAFIRVKFSEYSKGIQESLLNLLHQARALGLEKKFSSCSLESAASVSDDENCGLQISWRLLCREVVIRLIWSINKKCWKKERERKVRCSHPDKPLKCQRQVFRFRSSFAGRRSGFALKTVAMYVTVQLSRVSLSFRL